MKILVINAGSSSLKYQLIDMQNESVLAKGICERIGQDHSVLKHRKSGADEVEFFEMMPTHREAINLVLSKLVAREGGVISKMSEIGAVGHRVVHAGIDFNHSVVVTDEVVKKLEEIYALAPLHVPGNVTGIKACREAMPDTPMVVVFDTAFHSTMPDYAYMYGIPYAAYEKWRVRKYGFHGTSHKYVSGEAACFLKKDLSKLRLVTCHLGNGSSISAVKFGKCVDTSMGFTPLEGLPMGTRSGDIDPSAVEYLMDKTGKNIHEMLEYLNKECGMLGVSGISSDFRDLTKASEEGNDRARLALDMFSYRVKKYIGAYAAAMGGLDAIVFTAGVGENTYGVREKAVEGLEFLGVEMDKKLNAVRMPGNRDISAKKSKVRILVIPTNEELTIARETQELI